MTVSGQQKPSKGDKMRLNADFIAGTVDMLARDQMRRLGQGPLDLVDLSAPPLEVKNATGEFLPRFGICCFGDPTVDASKDEFKNQLVIEAIAPEEGKLHQFAISIESANENDICSVVSIGCVQVRVNVTSEGHEYAQAVADDINALESCGYGPAEMLWREGGTGEQWAIVRLAPLARPVRWVKCSTTPDVTVYPSAGNVMPVEFGEYAIAGDLSSLVGSFTSPTWASYGTPKYGLAVDLQRRFWADGSYARVTWLDGQWTFERANGVIRAKSTTTITAGSTGTANVYQAGGIAYSVTVQYDWIDGSGNIPSGRELLIEWFDDDAQWRVVGGECGP